MPQKEQIRRLRMSFQPNLSKLNETQLASYHKGICVVCLKNKGRLAGNLFCEPCEKLVTAERTRTKYGASKARGAFDAIRVQFAELVVPLIKKGMTRDELAAKLGLKPHALATRLHRLRKAGFDIPKMYRPHTPATATPGQPRNTGKAINEHGGGVWGVRGCRCEPCIERRRAAARDWRENRKRVKQAQQREAAKAAKAARR